jgi:ankyrin repeat protein
VAINYKFNGTILDALNAKFLDCVAKHDVERAKYYLVESGANINARDAHDDTALLRAVRDADTKMALMLIEKKASLDAQDNDGATALIIASKRADIPLVKALLDAGAEIGIEDSTGKKALDYAMRSADPALVELFEKPLKLALNRIPSSDFAQALRTSQCNLDDINPATGNTVLTWAASQKGQESLALAFIEAGASLNTPNRDGKTPVQVARETNNSPMLKLLEEAQKHKPGLIIENRGPLKPIYTTSN